jgi:hypothetical protein
MLEVVPQLCGAAGLKPLRAAIADPTRYAIEPKVDGVRGLVVFEPDGMLTTRNRRGEARTRGHRPGEPVCDELAVEDRPLVEDRQAPPEAA